MFYRPIISLIIIMLAGATGLHGQSDRPQGEVPRKVSILEPYVENEVFRGKELFRQIPKRYMSHPEVGLKPYNCKVDSAFELIHKRTKNTRTLVKIGTDGAVMYKQKVYGKFHYKDENGWWRTIDPRLKAQSKESGIFVAPDQPVPVKVDLKNDFTSLTLVNGFEFSFNKTSLMAENENGEVIYVENNKNLDQYWYGTNGVINKDFWPDINREVFADRGNLKTNFILEKEPGYIKAGGFLVIEDTIDLPSGYVLKEVSSGGYRNDFGDWQGKLQLLNSTGQPVAFIDPLKIFDKNGRVRDHANFPAGYRLEQTSEGYRLQIRMASEWLQDESTTYPVKIDPFVYGADTFQKQAMGFDYDIFYDDPALGGTFSFCPYFMTVKVPGKSELVKTEAEFESQSFNGGCPDFSDCELEEIAFRLLQPCGPSIYFYCPDTNFLAGLCYTKDPFVTDDEMACLDPKCPPHYLDFELRLFHGSCDTPDCDSSCHKMFTGTWIMTITARTLEGNINATAPYCKGDTVQLKAHPSWGVPPYNYLWLHNGDTNRTTFAVPTTDSTFVCRIRDSCSLKCDTCGNVVYDTLHLQVRENPDVTTSATDATCSQGEDGTITAQGSNTQEPYSYEWNTNPPTQKRSVDSVPVGWYRVTVTDLYGCDTEDSVEVGYINLMEIDAEVDSISCYGKNDGQISLNVTGTPPYEFNWSNGDTLASVSSLGPGVYSVTVTDDINCDASLTIELSEPDSLWVDAGMDQTIIKGETLQLDAQSTATGGVEFRWVPGMYLNDSTIKTPIASPDTTTLYTVTVHKSTNFDCFASDSVRIEVLERERLYAPTAFTPNGDGINDVFVVKGKGQLISLMIYDRWGNLVYEGTEGWNGTVGGVPQPIGTYVFVVKYRMVEGGEIKIEKGNLTLIR